MDELPFQAYLKFHPDDVADFKEVFNYFDKDKTGFITSKKVATTLRCLVPKPQDLEVNKKRKYIDKEKDGKADFTEFLLYIYETIEATKKKHQPKQRKRSCYTNLSQDQINEIRDAFSMFDQDDDGTLTIEELGTVMKSLGQESSEVEIREMIKCVDTTNSGTLDFPEFLTMMTRKMSNNEINNEAMETFRFFDKDGDGTISAEEVKSVMLKFGEKLTDEEINEMITEADEDGDGEITYTEFVKMMNLPKDPSRNSFISR